MWLSRTSAAVAGKNSKYFVPEGLCHFLTLRDLKGAGQQG